MKTPQLLVLLSSTLVGVSQAFPADRSTPLVQDKYASWDDVNVVAHGLLQLGQGLKEHVDKTKAQMRDINRKLMFLDTSVVEVEKRQKEQEEALRARSREVEEREKLLAQMAEEVRVKAEEVKKQSENINFNMEKVEGRGHVGASLIQVRKAPSRPGWWWGGLRPASKTTAMVFAEDAGGSEHAHRPAGEEDRATTRQAGQAEPPPANTTEQGDVEPQKSSFLSRTWASSFFLVLQVSHRRLKKHRRRDEGTAARREEKQSGEETKTSMCLFITYTWIPKLWLVGTAALTGPKIRWNFRGWFLHFALVSGRGRDCHHLYIAGQRASGVYTIHPDGSEPFAVFCDMTAGWSHARHLPQQQWWATFKHSFCCCRRWVDGDPETPWWIPELQPAVGKLQERLWFLEWWGEPTNLRNYPRAAVIKVKILNL